MVFMAWSRNVLHTASFNPSTGDMVSAMWGAVVSVRRGAMVAHKEVA